jgi:hypothetical protein
MPSRAKTAPRLCEESLYLAHWPAADSFFVKDAERHSFSLHKFD